MKIIFADNFPEMMQASIEPMLEQVVWLLPLWVQRLCVFWVSQEKTKSAYMMVSRDYRWVALYICPSFANKKRDAAIETLYHEVHHAYNATLIDIAEQMIDSLCPEKEKIDVKKLWQSRFISEVERVNQDFAYTLANKFKLETEIPPDLLNSEIKSGKQE